MGRWKERTRAKRLLRKQKSAKMERRKADEAEVEAERGGGAGGKTTRRSVRRAHSGPYDRPSCESREQQRKKTGGERWLTKLIVDPASRIFPSFFSSYSSRCAPRQGSPSSPSSDATILPETEQEACGNIPTLIYDNQISQSSEAGAPTGPYQPKHGFESGELMGDKLENAYDGSGLAEIEKRLKQKTFSRDEFNRLVELLRSRTVDLSQDDRCVGLVSEAAEDAPRQNDIMTSLREKQSVLLDHGVTGKIHHPLHQSIAPDEVGASPVEIAKAFMGARTSALDCTFQCGRVSDDLVSKSSSSSLVQNSPICWPGAVTQGDCGYFTPQSQSGRIGLHNFPRTPYSREFFSRSTSKFQCGGESPLNLPPTSWKQSPSPVFGGNQRMKRRNSILDDGSTSICPTLGILQKNMPTSVSNGSALSNSAHSVSSLSASSTFQMNIAPGSSKSNFLKFQSTGAENEVSIFNVSSIVHPQSSEMARKILKHIDKTVHSPTEKLLELKQVVARKKLSPKSASEIQNGLDRKFVPHYSDSQSTSCFDVGTQGSVDAQKVFEEPSNKKFNDKNQLLSIHPHTGNQCIPGLICSAAGSKELQIQTPLHHFFGGELVSNSISITKPDKKHLSYSDDGFGFTFPISATSDSLCEPPPTPNMTPSLSTRKPEAEVGTIPSFSFGSASADNGPVFSFGSFNSPTFFNTSNPKFTFGSDKKTGVSFRSSGKDAICC